MNAPRYPIQIISYPTLRREGDATILGTVQWLTYNDLTSERKEFDTCRITAPPPSTTNKPWLQKLRAAWHHLKSNFNK